MDADELQIGDRLVGFGRLESPVEIKSSQHIKILGSAGFSKVLVVRFMAKTQDPKYPVLDSFAYDFEPPPDPPKTAPTKRGPAAQTAKDQTAAGRLRAIQDHLGWARETLEEGSRTLEELYSGNFFSKKMSKKNLQGAVDLGAELAKLVEANPDSGNVISLLSHEDQFTYRHSVDVAHYVISTCHVMRNEVGGRLAAIAVGALLHDVGKSKLPRDLLEKETKFEKRDKQQMETHPVLGSEILSELGFASLQVDMTRHHHVTRSGGYPNYPFDKVSTLARLTGTSDIYQALTTPRPYKEPESANQALQTLLKLAKTQLDPQVVLFFIKALGVYPVGSTVELSNGEVAFVVGKGANSARPKVVPVVDAQGGLIQNNELLDLARPDLGELKIEKPVNHRDYFKNNALDLFGNLSLLSG